MFSTPSHSRIGTYAQPASSPFSVNGVQTPTPSKRKRDDEGDHVDDDSMDCGFGTAPEGERAVKQSRLRSPPPSFSATNPFPLPTPIHLPQHPSNSANTSANSSPYGYQFSDDIAPPLTTGQSDVSAAESLGMDMQMDVGMDMGAELDRNDYFSSKFQQQQQTPQATSAPFTTPSAGIVPSPFATANLHTGPAQTRESPFAAQAFSTSLQPPPAKVGLMQPVVSTGYGYGFDGEGMEGMDWGSDGSNGAAHDGMETMVVGQMSGNAQTNAHAAVENARNVHGPNCRTIPQLKLSDYPHPATGKRTMWSVCSDCGSCEMVAA